MNVTGPGDSCQSGDADVVAVETNIKTFQQGSEEAGCHVRKEKGVCW